MSYEAQREIIAQKVGDFSGNAFEALALEVFRFQASHNELYARFLSLLKVDAQRVSAMEDIPCLPIGFFKNHAVKTGNWQEEAIFTSSGTTGSEVSRHYVRDLDFFKKNTVKGFARFYGNPAEWCVLALLPAYLERPGSSLVCMAEHFIRLSECPRSGFFLKNTGELLHLLEQRESPQQKTLLLGVSFALLDLAESSPLDLHHVTVMETGGMKGRRREMTREELHEALGNAFHLPAVHAEYGMTELFSQAYSQGGGMFLPAPTLKVFAREITDPLTLQSPGKTGALNIIDLANFDTCSFIATDDLGRVHTNGSFEVLGRLDNSDIRGCNLMVNG